ncbi:MAG: MarR family winged helix-turn-helix transcriptional regulator [Stomatobaculum sp.]
MPEQYEALKLENQICFPLYAAAKEVVRLYRPFLEEIELTYTQYIVMLVIWEQDGMSVKELGDKLLLDSGTLTPVLKTLEQKGYVLRKRSPQDERSVRIHRTELGFKLRERAAEIPRRMRACIPLNAAETAELYHLLYKVLGK